MTTILPKIKTAPPTTVTQTITTFFPSSTIQFDDHIKSISKTE